MIWFRNGAMLKKYEGDKSLDALKAFVKKMAAGKPAKTAAKKAGKKKSTAKPKKQELWELIWAWLWSTVGENIIATTKNEIIDVILFFEIIIFSHMVSTYGVKEIT